MLTGLFDGSQITLIDTEQVVANLPGDDNCPECQPWSITGFLQAQALLRVDGPGG